MNGIKHSIIIRNPYRLEKNKEILYRIRVK